jgi:hypothetical protein
MTMSSMPGCVTPCGCFCRRTAVSRPPPSGSSCTRTVFSIGSARPRRPSAIPSPRTDCLSSWPSLPANGSAPPSFATPDSPGHNTRARYRPQTVVTRRSSERLTSPLTVRSDLRKRGSAQAVGCHLLARRKSEDARPESFIRTTHQSCGLRPRRCPPPTAAPLPPWWWGEALGRRACSPWTGTPAPSPTGAGPA